MWASGVGLGLIVTELFIDALKYAFEETATNGRIEDKWRLAIDVKDYGVRIVRKAPP